MIERELNGETFRRGSGISLIEAKGVTASEVEAAVENSDEVIRDEDEFVIIGPSGQTLDDQIAVSGGSGATIRANSVGANNDVCGDYVQIENDAVEDGNPEHTLDGSALEIENAKRIIDAGDKRYYIGKPRPGMADEKFATIVTEKLNEGVKWLITSNTKEDEGLHDSVDEAERQDVTDQDSATETVYDEESGKKEC